MSDVGYISYLSASIAYALLAMLLLTSWRGGYRGGLLASVAVIHVLWAGFAANAAYHHYLNSVGYVIFEVLRYVAWYVFLLKLLQLDDVDVRASKAREIFQKIMIGSVCFALIVMMTDLSKSVISGYFSVNGVVNASIALHIALAIIGLAIIEQMYRNISMESRWSVKFFILAAGLMFIYDLFMYSDALLFSALNEGLWDARGFVVILAMPLVAIATARSKKLSLKIFVSRDVVLHTSAIMGGGVYLLVMSAIGFYLREAGGKWGVTIQVLFLSLSMVLLIIVLFSTHLRAQSRVFIGKHFYKNKYDYRREWLQLNDRLLYDGNETKQFESSIKAMASIVDCRDGLLWLRDGRKNYHNRAALNCNVLLEAENLSSSFISYLATTDHIVNLAEINARQHEYQDLVLPSWIKILDDPWLIVPLSHGGNMLGFIVLARPLVVKKINWEDRDLLKVAGQQIANYITVILTGGELAQARQFEAFNRLSAYMVHDLKNIAAELELVVKNSDKHGSNQAFLNDAFDTIGNASQDIKRLLDQLRGKRAETGRRSVVDLQQVVNDVVKQMQGKEPAPEVTNLVDGCFICVEKNRLAIVLRHLIENAQQATSADGYVYVCLEAMQGKNVVKIEDNGCGMDEGFIRERLFKPFDTTKGNSGMGIGMHESREIIQANGGEIQVSSQSGKGSVIALVFPAEVPPTEESAA